MRSALTGEAQEDTGGSTGLDAIENLKQSWLYCPNFTDSPTGIARKATRGLRL
jgi:hypothetical protein